jgi:hypothetical protein
MADNSPHVNVPTGARTPYAPIREDPNVSGGSPMSQGAMAGAHIMVPTGERVAYDAADEGAVGSFVKLPAGKCDGDSFENPSEWPDTDGWRQT